MNAPTGEGKSLAERKQWLQNNPQRAEERVPAAIAPQHSRTIESCGSCSAMICPHGICRQCSRCPECDERIALLDQLLDQADAAERQHGRATAGSWKAAAPFVRSVRLNHRQSSRNALDIAARAQNFSEYKIPAAEWVEASEALDELLSDCCQCGNRKLPHNAFCPDCYHQVPSRMREGLKKHMAHGYLDSYRRACAWLGAEQSETETLATAAVGGGTAPVGATPYRDPARDTEGPRAEPELDDCGMPRTVHHRCTPRHGVTTIQLPIVPGPAGAR